MAISLNHSLACAGRWRRPRPAACVGDCDGEVRKVGRLPGLFRMAISRKHIWPARGAGAGHALSRALTIAVARSDRIGMTARFVPYGDIAETSWRGWGQPPGP